MLLFGVIITCTFRIPLNQLGSTSKTAIGDGTVTYTALYKAWGEERYTSGTAPTTYKYTGQREEASFGLYFYNARWYDPALGRFTQPDTIVPDGVQGWDRYAYVNNNPLKYNDPSGHNEDCGIGDPYCSITPSDKPEKPPSDPSDQTYPLNYWGGSTCDLPLADCFGDTVYLKDFSEFDEYNPIPIEEFNELADEVAEDLYTHDLGSWPGFEAGRSRYDTPFYNGGESRRRTRDRNSVYGDYPADQNVCVETIGCSGRSEVNYFAQGMWGAAIGEPKPVSAFLVIAWKFVEYQEFPSKNTMFWLYYGYEYYQVWEQNQSK